MSWRYIATRISGDGTETVVHPELPLSDVSFTRSKNQPTEMSGTVSPEYKFLVDETGNSLLDRWATGIYAESDGNIRAGGILVDDQIDPESAQLELTIMGHSGYPNGQAYTEGDTWPPNPYPTGGIEPMDAVREIWRHLQAQPGGDIGVIIDSMNTGKLIGKQVAQGEFDTENGPLSFEYEPFLLRWFETHDLGDRMQDILTNTPLDFIEEHSWLPGGEQIEHRLRFGYPSIGARREDHRFVMGENVELSAIDPPADEYASVVLGLGAGEGSAMKRGMAYRSDERRIRRAVVFEDKAARTNAAIGVSARRELLSRIGVDDVSSIKVKPEHVKALMGIEPGDEIRLLGDTPFRPVDMWVRIQGKTETPADGSLEFAVSRSDRLA